MLDDELPPEELLEELPDALLVELVSDVALVCDVAEVDCVADVAWDEAAAVSELTELIDMGFSREEWIGAGHAGWRLARFFNADVRQSWRHELCLIVSVCCFANERLKQTIARTFLPPSFRGIRARADEPGIHNPCRKWRGGHQACHSV
ncbi:hypothetical protein [Bradyrhizobium sp. STM 3843]|uniref:hypothetical protein n=1 Tax=Bradyrhizobium sp. STM 3843 TaxID=551947 RepID=UPI001112A10C|nr:hypothetical protein [Bradyrhizobium sp. STM 3843]